jgi:hypothetical protein
MPVLNPNTSPTADKIPVNQTTRIIKLPIPHPVNIPPQTIALQEGFQYQATPVQDQLAAGTAQGH